MKILIFILILLSFLQATILPLNLVLIILILRAYIVNEPANLYLGFFFGLLMSFLNFTPLGLQSILYLTLIEVTQALTKSRLSGHILTVIPLILIALIINGLVFSLQLWPRILIELILALPIYIALRFWEERFVVRDIKLKL